MEHAVNLGKNSKLFCNGRKNSIMTIAVPASLTPTSVWRTETPSRHANPGVCPLSAWRCSYGNETTAMQWRSEVDSDGCVGLQTL